MSKPFLARCILRPTRPAFPLLEVGTLYRVERHEDPHEPGSDGEVCHVWADELREANYFFRYGSFERYFEVVKQPPAQTRWERIKGWFR